MCPATSSLRGERTATGMRPSPDRVATAGGATNARIASSPHLAPPPQAARRRGARRTIAACGAPSRHALHERPRRTNASCGGGAQWATHASPLSLVVTLRSLATSCLRGDGMTTGGFHHHHDSTILTMQPPPCHHHHGAAITAYAATMHPTALAARRRPAPPHASPHHRTPPQCGVGATHGGCCRTSKNLQLEKCATDAMGFM